MKFTDEELEDAVQFTLKLMRNKDHMGIEHHKRWVSACGVEFRREHDRLVRERRPVRNFEPFR